MNRSEELREGGERSELAGAANVRESGIPTSRERDHEHEQ